MLSFNGEVDWIFILLPHHEVILLNFNDYNMIAGVRGDNCVICGKYYNMDIACVKNARQEGKFISTEGIATNEMSGISYILRLVIAELIEKTTASVIESVARWCRVAWIDSVQVNLITPDLNK